MAINYLLSELGKLAAQSRPNLGSGPNATLDRFSNNLARLWVRTMGCTHSLKHGGCTTCDYWVGPKVSDKDQLLAVMEKIEELRGNPTKMLLINTNGSVLDEEEINRNVLIEILKRIEKRIPGMEIILETRVETITKESLTALETLRDIKITFEVGIESALPQINNLCCNKNIDLTIVPDIVKNSNVYGFDVIGNVLIGLPFLSQREIIESAKATIKWCFDNHLSTCVLFPVCVKPHTTLYWLYEHDFYRPISLWILIDVLNDLPKEYLNHIEVSWFDESLFFKNTPEEYKKPIFPVTCDNCKEEFTELLIKFVTVTKSRLNTLTELNRIQCDCRNEWNQQSLAVEKQNFQDRINQQYREIAIIAFGNEWFLKKEMEIFQNNNMVKGL